MNNEITQHAKDLLDKGAERNKKHLEQMRKKEEKPLRDHFAGLAMNAFLQSPFQMQKLTGDVNENDTQLAVTCYRVADAMLKARLVTEDKEVYGE